MVVSALPNDRQYVSPASTKAPSPMGSRGGSFTGTPRPGPALSGPSDQSAQSTGRPADTGDTASSGENRLNVFTGSHTSYTKAASQGNIANLLAGLIIVLHRQTC